MSILDQLPKDQAGAAAILDALEEKDQDETKCCYPTCKEPRRTGIGIGHPPYFCENPEHDALNNFRARKKLARVAAGEVLETSVKRRGEQPSARSALESTRGTVLSAMQHTRNVLDQYITLEVDITDPDLIAAREEANQDQTAVRVAEADQRASTEKELRLAAQNATQAAQRDATAAREAAELAIRQLEESEQHAQELRIETEQRIAEAWAERDIAIEQIRTETKNQIEAIEARTRLAIAATEEIAANAQAEADEAKELQRNAEEKARAEVLSAERLVAEARTERDRDRQEVERLRQELNETRQRAEAERADARQILERERNQASAALNDARQRAEAERADARQTLERERAQASAVLAREQGEIKRLQTIADKAEQRADQLATLADSLREQLLQNIKERGQQ